MKKVAVGISGGVDSSVAAWLLKQEGYDVSGIFMINWHNTTGVLQGDCPWHDDLVFAELACKKLGIPLTTVDFSEQYYQRVVNYMFDEYSRGRTPNPDVLCNREIKFDLLLKAALDQGADFVATGHYCRKESLVRDGKNIYRLLAGADNNKDQSYFLCQLTQEQLKYALFPVGHLVKGEVREIAGKAGLATATRKDSQGICFVGKVDLPLFLQQKLKPRKGRIIEVPRGNQAYREYDTLASLNALSSLDKLSGKFIYRPDDGIAVGEHNGAHFFTIGQRKGIQVGGKEKPLFVIGIDVAENIVYVGMGEDHPGLYHKALFMGHPDVHWIRDDLAGQHGPIDVLARVRYRQPLQHAQLLCTPEGAYLNFAKAQRGIAPGQFAAWYNNDELLGSGVIH